MKTFRNKDAKKELENGYGKAEKLLKDDQKMERFLQRLEKKLKIIPVGGETLSMIPTMVSLLRSYVKKEYNDVPIVCLKLVGSDIKEYQKWRENNNNNKILEL